MPVIISNVTPASHIDGPAIYEVRVNDELKARYSHHRQDGLAECLRKAAEAIDAETSLTAFSAALKSGAPDA